MPTPNQLYLASFVRRANLVLAVLARELAGALAAGDEETMRYLTYKGELLRHGLASVESDTNRLCEPDKVYIVEKLLGLLPEEIASPQPGPIEAGGLAELSLNPLRPRVRGLDDPEPLAVAGAVGGIIPVGAELIISRDGQEIGRLAAVVGAYLLTDATPGQRYRVELTGTQLGRERVRPLVSGVLFGTGPANAPASYLTQLPISYPGFVQNVGRFTATGQRNRILLGVPVSEGRVTLLTQPDDQDADITMAFTRRTVTLDFGTDGKDEYEVLENYADYLGAFTLDAHLTP